jgi:hypothetical protein
MAQESPATYAFFFVVSKEGLIIAGGWKDKNSNKKVELYLHNEKAFARMYIHTYIHSIIIAKRSKHSGAVKLPY